jgi:hypothetical protein
MVNSSHRVSVAGDTLLNIELPRLGISGRVVESANGAAVSAATVVLRAQATSAEPAQLITTVYTDANGNFTIPGLKDREYDLVIYKRGFQAAKQAGGILPGGPPVAVEMTRASGDRLRVRDAASGAPLRFVRVTVTGASGSASMDVPLDTDGSGEVPRMFSGRYDLTIAWDGYASQQVTAVVPDDPRLEVALQPGGQIQLDVRRDLRGYQAVLVYPDESRVPMTLTRSITLSVPTGDYVFLLTDPAGNTKVFRGRVTASGVTSFVVD